MDLDRPAVGGGHLVYRIPVCAPGKGEAGQHISHGVSVERSVEELMRLAEPDRSTLLLRYLDGMSASDIARERGESAAAVRKRVGNRRSR